MELYPLVFLVSAIVINLPVVMLILIYKKTKGAALLIFSCLLNFIWLLAYCFLTASGWEESRLFWYRLSLSFVFFYPPTALLILLNVAIRRRTSLLQVLLILLPAAVFFILSQFSTLLPVKFLLGRYGYALYFQPNELSVILNKVLSLIYIPLIAILSLHHYIQAQTIRRKRQFLMFLIAVFSGLLTVLFVLFSQGPEHYYTPLGLLLDKIIYQVCLCMLVFRYRMTRPSPSFLLDQLWENIEEPILLIDSDNLVSSFNRPALDIWDKDQLRGAPFLSLFDSPVKLDVQNHTVSLINKEGFSVVARMYLVPLRDSFKDYLGAMAILRNILSHQDIKSRFGITRREWELALMLSEGKEYSEIAKALELSFHTVKTHAHNLYKKAGVKSRHELQALLFL